MKQKIGQPNSPMKQSERPLAASQFGNIYRKQSTDLKVAAERLGSGNKSLHTNVKNRALSPPNRELCPNASVVINNISVQIKYAPQRLPTPSKTNGSARYLPAWATRQPTQLTAKECTPKPSWEPPSTLNATKPRGGNLSLNPRKANETKAETFIGKTGKCLTGAKQRPANFMGFFRHKNASKGVTSNLKTPPAPELPPKDIRPKPKWNRKNLSSPDVSELIKNVQKTQSQLETTPKVAYNETHKRIQEHSKEEERSSSEEQGSSLAKGRNSTDLKRYLSASIQNHCLQTRSVPPTTLSYYRIVRLLGQGSYARVYLAFSVLTELPVAIKCYEKSKISSEAGLRQIFREVEITRDLHHVNVIRFIEIFEEAGSIFVVLEYADGGDLLSHIKQIGRFEEAELLDILGQLLRGLQYLHSKRVLHRDIKLDNVLLTARGEVKICDFGVSTRVPRNGFLTEHTGTPAYLAPEIVEGRGYTGFQVDIWSLGVLTFIAALGAIPFNGNTITQLNHSILHSEPLFPSDIELSPLMRALLVGMLRKNPRARLTVPKIAETIGVSLFVPDPDPPPIRVARVLERVVRLGYSHDLVVASFESGQINHISALANIFDIAEQ